jgi:formylglycine-generating enzyme required for sulfatase activity
MNRPKWDQPTPYGMVVIPPGSFHLGQNDQDVNYSQIAHNKQITISAFYMDDTEITNNEYRQFITMAMDTLPADVAELVYPDTMVWMRDFVFAYNEPLTENYYWHPAFDDYPVVGVNWYAASEFCRWRTSHYNDYRAQIEMPPLPRFRLPTEAEWEYASRGGFEHKSILGKALTFVTLKVVSWLTLSLDVVTTSPTTMSTLVRYVLTGPMTTVSGVCLVTLPNGAKMILKKPGISIPMT